MGGPVDHRYQCGENQDQVDRRRAERTVKDGAGKYIVEIPTWTEEERYQQDSRGNRGLDAQGAAVITGATQCGKEQQRKHDVKQREKA